MRMRASCVAVLVSLMALCGAQTELPGKTTFPTTSEAPTEATYWVTFNTNIRPGQNMSFNVLIIKGTSPVMVAASLLDSKGSKVILQSKQETCEPGVLQTVDIEIPLNVEQPSENRWDNYQVRVLGVGAEVNINETGYANIRGKPFSIFIQTDKAIYKPGQEVKFRALSIDPQMQVMREAIYDIVVKDSRNNRIVHLRDVNPSENLGVVQSSFRLADQVATGDWKIEISVMGFEETKSFAVDDYVLPKFEVEITAPPFGLTNDLSLDFIIKAKYTFGQPVSDSEVTVEIKTAVYNRKTINFRGMLNRDGQYQGSVPTDKLVGLVQEHSPYRQNIECKQFVINATVTEARTDKMQHADHMIQYFATPLKMTFLPITPKSYKAGMDFNAYLEVRKRDESLFTPEESRNIKINFSVTYQVRKEPKPTQSPKTSPLPTAVNGTTAPSLMIEGRIWQPGHFYEQETRDLVLPQSARVQDLPDSGWLVLNFQIPASALSFQIKATSETPYSRSDDAYFQGSPAKSPSNSFLQLNVTNHKPKVGDVVSVKVTATATIRALNFQLSAKGIVLLAKRVVPNTPSKEMDFEFVTDSTMSPNLNLLAFFVTDDGEIVVDSLSLSVEGLFADSVEIRFSKEKVKPGEAVDLLVKGKPNSMVFLLGVDKSVKLLKSGNDITQEMVRQELLKYESGSNYGPWRYMFICGWPSYNSGQDAASVFESAGVQVLTDGLVYRRTYDWFDNGHILESVPDSGIAATATDDTTQQKNPGETESSENEKPRTNFLEIMLWEAVTIPEQSSGEAIVPLTVPDTITSWVTTAFSTHPSDGLSVAEKPAEVITFKDLFVSVDLPSFIVRYENFCFTASVFSYYKNEVPVLVTLEKSPDFSGLYTKRRNKDVTVENEKLYYTVFLGPMREGDIKATKFCFIPEVLGMVTVLVTARTDIAGLSDTVQHKIRVKPEGVPRSIVKPYLVSLQNGQWNASVPVPFPPRTVPGSEKVTVNVAGNILASVYENMDNLVRQPYGCGEQNMINFAPLISLLKFFRVTNKMTPEMEQKILNFMSQGYQRELTYEHGSTGGYSTFGDNGNYQPSTWLTAFVLKCYAQAHQLNTPFTDVDAIARSALWLAKNNKRGAFVENGKVFNKRLQGGSGTSNALTAYAIIALHEATLALEKGSMEYNNTIVSRDRAVNYLETRIPQLTDVYDVCITTYALHLVDSKQKDVMFDKMELLAYIADGLKHWELLEQRPVYKYSWSRTSDPMSIEMTSYALLVYSLRGIITTKGLGVITWLSEQKNANGGFISTQDTVIGIEAMSSFLSEASYIPMSITVVAGNHNKTFDMSVENEMLFQMFEVPYESISQNITFEAVATNFNGNAASTVLVEVSRDFNVEDMSESEVYQLEHYMEDNTLQMKISTVNNQLAGMTLVEIELHSGFGIESDNVMALNPSISRVEYETDDMCVLYVDTDVIGPRPIKLQVPLIRTGGLMTKPKTKSIKISSYYDPDVQLTREYNLIERKFCDIVADFGLCFVEVNK